jgi:hypothetical protein
LIHSDVSQEQGTVYRNVTRLSSDLLNLLLSKNMLIKMRRVVILCVVLCGCETWSVTLREECRLMVFERRVLRKMFGSEREGSDGRLEKTA